MSREETKDLLQFLQPFGEEISQLVLWLREFVWKLYPSSNELIYDNYNALALAGRLPTVSVIPFVPLRWEGQARIFISDFIGAANFRMKIIF